MLFSTFNGTSTSFLIQTSAFAAVRYVCGPIVGTSNSVRKSLHPVCNCDESRNLSFQVSELEERCKSYKSPKWRFSYSLKRSHRLSHLRCSLLDLLHIHVWLEVRLGDCLSQLAIENHEDCDFKFHNRSRDAKVTRVQTRDSLAL